MSALVLFPEEFQYFRVLSTRGAAVSPQVTQHNTSLQHVTDPPTDNIEDHLPSVSHSGLSGHMRTLSLGSGVWDGEEDWDHLRLTPNSPSWTCIERGEGRRRDRMRERQWYVLNVHFVFSVSRILCLRFFLCVTLCRNSRSGHLAPAVFNMYPSIHFPSSYRKWMDCLVNKWTPKMDTWTH